VLLTVNWSDGTTTLWVVDPATEPFDSFTDADSHVVSIRMEYTLEVFSRPIRSTKGKENHDETKSRVPTEIEDVSPDG